MSRNSTIRKSLCARFKRFQRSEDASLAIEFAFVGPVFFLLILVFIETALMMFTEYSMQAAVSETARQIRTGQAQTGKWSATEFKVATCKISTLIPSCYSSLQVYVNSNSNFSAISTTAPSFTEVGTDKDGNVKNATFTCGTPLQVVAVIVTYDHKFILPIMRFFANTPNTTVRRLTASAVFRNEPYIQTNSCSAVPSALPSDPSAPPV